MFSLLPGKCQAVSLSGRIARNTGLMLVLAFATSADVAFVVNDLGDASDANPYDGVALTAGGVTTLRAAMEEFEGSRDTLTITFEEALFSEPAAIVLGSTLESGWYGTYNIIGPGKDLLAIDGGGSVQLFSFLRNTEATLTGLTLRKGKGESGGAIFSNNVRVTLQDCILEENTGTLGGAVYAEKKLSVYGCVFRRNKSETESPPITDEGCGGAILGRYASYVWIEDSLFEQNSSTFEGSAICIYGLALILDRSVFRQNCGDFTLYTSLSSAYMRDCAFSENDGGALGACCMGDTEEFSLIQCTIERNYARRGSTILLNGGYLHLFGCTIVDNIIACQNTDPTYFPCGGAIACGDEYYTRMYFGNTIISGNHFEDGVETDIAPVGWSSRYSHGGNFIGGNTYGTDEFQYEDPADIGTDQIGSIDAPLDARLDVLADNGGSVPTRMPLPDSPVINAGRDEATRDIPNPVGFWWGPDLVHDQRGEGYCRIRGAAVDIGAVETAQDVAPTHTADVNGDLRIDIVELMRVIQFYNMGGFHCADGTTPSEDGYAPGPGGDISCVAHASDYDGGQDWQINLTELLRLIELYNWVNYHPCTCEDGGAEDDYCI